MRLRLMPLLSEAMRPLTLQVQDDSRKTQALTLVQRVDREAQERLLKIPAPQALISGMTEVPAGLENLVNLIQQLIDQEFNSLNIA